MLILDYDIPQAAYLLLLIIPLALLYFYLSRYRKERLQPFSRSPLSKLILPRSRRLTVIKTACICLSWTLACLALMGPKGNMRYTAKGQGQQAIRYQPHDVIFLIDTSGSMAVKDARQGQSRLESAKDIANTIISQLTGENVALDAFTSVLTPLVPPTLDYLFARLQLRELTFNEGDKEGTDFKQVLKALKEQLLKDPPQKRHTVILLSDGGDNRVDALSGQAKEQAIEEILNTLKSNQPLHLTLWTIGMGSKEGGIIPGAVLNGKPVSSKLDNDLLKQLAERENGHYESAQDWTTWDLVQRIVNQINQDSLYQDPATQERTVVPIRQEDVRYDFYYQIPLALALLFLALYLILPDVRRL